MQKILDKERNREILPKEFPEWEKGDSWWVIVGRMGYDLT